MRSLFSPSFVRAGCVLMFAVCFDACAAAYLPRPVYQAQPDSLPEHATVPGAEISVGAVFCDTPELVHIFFGRQGLWRKHTLPLLLSIQSFDSKSFLLSLQGITIEDVGRIYHPISPAEAFDLAWQSKRPFMQVKKVLYYGGLILFIIVTLGLGSTIWVLPSPFQQPKPDADPFGRDLAYKALPEPIRIDSGTVSGGMVYFHLLDESLKSPELSLRLRMRSEGSSPETKMLVIKLPQVRSEEHARVRQWMEDFFR